MKVLVSVDDHVYQYKGDYYVRAYVKTLMMRYLDVFSSVRFAVRVNKVNSFTELGVNNVLLELKTAEIFPFPLFQGIRQFVLKQKEIKRTAKKAVEGCAGAILRTPSNLGFVLVDSLKKKNIPYMLEVVANPNEVAANTKSTRAYLAMKQMDYKLRNACKSADGIAYVTRYSLQDRYPAKKSGAIITNYSSVDLSKTAVLKPRKHPGNKKFVICHVAQQIKIYGKGHIQLIDAVKLLKEMGHEVEVKFAGDGIFVEKFKNYAIEQGVGDHIHFVGYISLAELNQLMLDSDLMLFPTRSEGLPRVIIEAMATGLPCVSTPVGGIPELLPEELMFHPDDVTGFANKTKELIEQPDLYEMYSKQAIDKAGEYTSDVLQKRRNQFFEKFREFIGE